MQEREFRVLTMAGDTRTHDFNQSYGLYDHDRLRELGPETIQCSVDIDQLINRIIVCLSADRKFFETVECIAQEHLQNPTVEQSEIEAESPYLE